MTWLVGQFPADSEHSPAPSSAFLPGRRPRTVGFAFSVAVLARLAGIVLAWKDRWPHLTAALGRHTLAFDGDVKVTTCGGKTPRPNNERRAQEFLEQFRKA